MKRLINIEELSSILGVKVGTLRYWVFSKKIPHKKLNNLVRFCLEEVEDWYSNSSNDSNYIYNKKEV